MKYLCYIICFFLCFIWACRPLDVEESLRQANKATYEGDYAPALKLYNRVLKQAPEHAEAYYHRGNVKYNLQDYEGAVEDCKKSISINPNLKDAYFNLGISYFHLDRYQEAIKELSQAILIDAKDNEAYRWRGMANFKLKRLDQACQDWQDARKLGNTYVNPYLNRHCQSEAEIESGDD